MYLFQLTLGKSPALIHWTLIPGGWISWEQIEQLEQTKHPGRRWCRKREDCQVDRVRCRELFATKLVHWGTRFGKKFFLLWLDLSPSFLHQWEFMVRWVGCVISNWFKRPSCWKVLLSYLAFISLADFFFFFK